MIKVLLYFSLHKGYRLNSTVIKHTHALSGVECVLLCMQEDELCRSTNFKKKQLSCDKNCEFLEDVGSEIPDQLIKDEKYDYYVLLEPKRKKVRTHTSKVSTDRLT